MEYSVSIIILWVITAILFLVLRILPIWPSRNQGCDTYNILLCAETLRRDKKLPIRLPPVFILEEEEQWYPPGFLILCALLPQKWLNNWFWLLNHLIDLAHVSIAFIILAANGYELAGAISMLIYAALAPLTLEFTSLNTRPLGLLVLSAFLLSTYAGMESPLWALVTGVLGIALFYSHKLSLQQLWFTLPILSLITGDVRWGLWLFGIYFCSWLLWPTGFRNIVSGHRAIISFWNRNWHRLGAHSIRQSNLYGDGTTRNDYYSIDGWLGVARLTRDALYQNFFIIPVVIFVYIRPWPGEFELYLFIWIFSVYVWAYMVHLIPTLRCVGLGRQYIKFALLPSLLYLTPIFIEERSFWSWLLLGLCILFSVSRYFLAFRTVRNTTLSQSGVDSKGLTIMLERLNKEPSARIMCLPVHLCDLVAYQSRLPTYWGTHSHCFDERLENFFPVLKYPLEHYVQDGELTHLLLDTRYALPEELGLLDNDRIEIADSYALYRLSGKYKYKKIKNALKHEY